MAAGREKEGIIIPSTMCHKHHIRKKYEKTQKQGDYYLCSHRGNTHPKYVTIFALQTGGDR
jgi:hypothetical protein